MLYPAHFFLFSGSFRFRCLFCAFLFFQGLVNLLYDLLGLLILRRSVELLVERLRKLLCLVIFLLFKMVSHFDQKIFLAVFIFVNLCRKLQRLCF